MSESTPLGAGGGSRSLVNLSAKKLIPYFDRGFKVDKLLTIHDTSSHVSSFHVKSDVYTFIYVPNLMA